MRVVIAGLAVATCAVGRVGAQSGFLDRWQARATATQSEQPHWVTPLVTVTPRLEQELRTDFVRQVAPALTSTWVYGNGKGLELIPPRRVEVLFNAPPYLQHNSATHDGFGDTPFLLKYRVAAANEEHGGYIVTAFLGGSIPTGIYKNGAAGATVTPSIAAGKGYRRVDVVSTAGMAFPVTNTATLGRPVLWNTTLQGKVGRFVWPEVESNAIFYRGGTNDGKVQHFLTPGIVFGRFRLSKDHPRSGATLGVGEQIATSHFHTYNHALVFTARLPF